MRDKFSRILIVVGSGIVFVLALRQFGDSNLALFASFCCFLIAVLALLFAPDAPSGDSHRSWFLRALYDLLQNRSTLRIVAAVIWLVVIGLGVREFRPAPAGKSPFYISYHTFHGQAIDILLEGHVDEMWEAKLEGQPKIIQTEVLTYLRKMQVTRLAAEWDGNFLIERIAKGNRRTDTVPAPVSSDGVARTSRYAVELETSRTQLPDVPDAIYDIVLPDTSWRLAPLYSGLIDYDERTIQQGYLSSLSFARYANLDDVRGIIRSEVRMSSRYAENSLASAYARSLLNHLSVYEELLGSNLPRNFFLLRTEHDGHGGIYIRYFPPTVRLKVAIVRNLHDAPQRLESFEVATDTVSGLRQKGRQVPKTSQSIPFPPLWLKPNDVVLVPIAIEMVTSGRFESDGDVHDEQSRLMGAVESSGFTWFQTDGESVPGTRSSTSLPRDVLLGLLSRGVLNPDSVLYQAGPSDSLGFIVSGGQRYRVRPEAQENVLVYRDENVGSCPYVAILQNNGHWKELGTVLTRFSTPAREGWDTLDLPDFNGTLRFMEKDAETTMIDYVELSAQGADGRWTRVPAPDAQLADSDGKYLILNRGDTITIDFHGGKLGSPPPGRARLIVKGFFLPLPGDPRFDRSPPASSFRVMGQ